MASVALASESPREPLDNLQAHPTVYNSGMLTKVDFSVSFCRTGTPAFSNRKSHVIIVKAHLSCFQNATGILGFLRFLSIWAKRIGSTCTLGYIFNQTFQVMTLCRRLQPLAAAVYQSTALLQTWKHHWDHLEPLFPVYAWYMPDIYHVYVDLNDIHGIYMVYPWIYHVYPSDWIYMVYPWIYHVYPLCIYMVYPWIYIIRYWCQFPPSA